MRFTLQLGFARYPDYQSIARTAEEAGFSSIGMPDSFFFPKRTDSEYPYTDTETIRGYIEHMAFIEPLVAMSWMAAVTQRIRLYPSVLKVPTRQPLVLAKALSSLAVLCQERILLGAGLSPWREDFSYNGVAFEKRGRLMDECIQILRGAMSGEYFEYHSENYDFGPMKMNPVPSRPVPIIVGGHSKPALQRAARLGDGWVSANTDFATLKSLLAELAGLRAAAGTAGRADFEIHGFDVAAQQPDDFRRLAELGVTDACVAPWGFDPAATLQAQLDAIRRFGDAVIAPLTGR
ncbi:MAG: TIGR03619 family F420-dependent LLM class oxidoreductase [Proteobacteria bacterium]|nr:TIGR03619 family F420-dependent LLM class oxidoreductase [Pseudomonadota bacterium]